MTSPDTAKEMPPPCVGVDLGATLAKLAVRAPGGNLHFEFLSASNLQSLKERIAELRPGRIGMTGCGASALEDQLDQPAQRCVEFEAWGRGSRTLLRGQNVDTDAPYLLVSLGTGTSILRVEGDEVARLGGTALGGGTMLGLGVALTGCQSHEELCRLAEEGDRGRVDLRVSDIYREGEIGLPGDTTAAAFGNLARWLSRDKKSRDEVNGAPSQPADLAAAVMGLVGENVALLCCGLAAATGVNHLVYGGGTLHHNPVLATIIEGVSMGLGRTPVFLENGSFAGAVGALERGSEA